MRRTATVTIAETATTAMKSVIVATAVTVAIATASTSTAVLIAWHRWGKGERIPPEYRDRQYVIDDWREHRLAPPPRGYHWVGVGGDYYLVAPTGIVFNVMIGG
jgi:Ni/Co efflux regulator RcnB